MENSDTEFDVDISIPVCSKSRLDHLKDVQDKLGMAGEHLHNCESCIANMGRGISHLKIDLEDIRQDLEDIADQIQQIKARLRSD